MNQSLVHKRSSMCSMLNSMNVLVHSLGNKDVLGAPMEEVVEDSAS